MAAIPAHWRWGLAPGGFELAPWSEVGVPWPPFWEFAHGQRILSPTPTSVAIASVTAGAHSGWKRLCNPVQVEACAIQESRPVVLGEPFVHSQVRRLL